MTLTCRRCVTIRATHDRDNRNRRDSGYQHQGSRLRPSHHGHLSRTQQEHSSREKRFSREIPSAVLSSTGIPNQQTHNLRCIRFSRKWHPVSLCFEWCIRTFPQISRFNRSGVTANLSMSMDSQTMKLQEREASSFWLYGCRSVLGGWSLMFGDPFYNQSLRKTVIAFGSLFNEIYIQRKEETTKEQIRVPLT